MATPEPTSLGIEGNDMTVGLAGERDKVEKPMALAPEGVGVGARHQTFLNSHMASTNSPTAMIAMT